MELSTAERMNLMKFVCSFVWTDLNVSQSERDLVMRMCGSLHLTEDETAHVKKWLELPPPIEEVDPTSVPSVAQLAKAVKPDMSDADLEKYYAEDNMRKALY